MCNEWTVQSLSEAASQALPEKTGVRRPSGSFWRGCTASRPPSVQYGPFARTLPSGIRKVNRVRSITPPVPLLATLIRSDLRGIPLTRLRQETATQPSSTELFIEVFKITEGALYCTSIRRQWLYIGSSALHSSGHSALFYRLRLPLSSLDSCTTHRQLICCSAD